MVLLVFLYYKAKFLGENFKLGKVISQQISAKIIESNIKQVMNEGLTYMQI